MADKGTRIKHDILGRLTSLKKSIHQPSIDPERWNKRYTPTYEILF